MQREEQAASTRVALLEPPCLAGARWLPLGQGFKGLVQSSGRGKLQFILSSAFLLALGARADALETGFKDQVSSSTFWALLTGRQTLPKAGGKERAVAASPTLSGLVLQEQRHGYAVTRTRVLFSLGIRTDMENQREEQH